MRDINKLKEDFENKKVTQKDMTQEEVLALKELYDKQIRELEKRDELLGKQIITLRRELDELLEKIK